MTVAVFPADDRGCGFYRLRHPATVLAARGHDVRIDPPDLGYYRSTDGRDPSRLFLDADGAVMQRVVTALAVDFAAAIKAHGHRLTVDVDDDLDALHDGHPYRTEVDGTRPDRHGVNLHVICAMADAVTVTTPALAERYGHDGNARVLPNLVPERYLRIRDRRKARGNRPLRVGWTGRPESHIGDASVMGGRVGPAVAEAGARFCAWGNTAPLTFTQVGVPPGHRETVPFRPITSGFPESVAGLDVGLVPLLDTEFNRAKSWLKGIEYAALGVPFVASPLPEYRKLADMGAGLLASTPGEWAEHVTRLLADPDERAERAERGRQVASTLTYEAHAERWLDVWAGEPATAMSDERKVAA